MIQARSWWWLIVHCVLLMDKNQSTRAQIKAFLSMPRCRGERADPAKKDSHSYPGSEEENTGTNPCRMLKISGELSTTWSRPEVDLCKSCLCELSSNIVRSRPAIALWAAYMPWSGISHYCGQLLSEVWHDRSSENCYSSWASCWYYLLQDFALEWLKHGEIRETHFENALYNRFKERSM